MPEDEPALVRLAASCNDRAFEALLDHVANCLYAVISRYVSNTDDQEDLRPEIITRLLEDKKRALRIWEPRAPFSAYVSTIAARHCINWCRKHGRLPQRQLPSSADEEGSVGVLECIAAPLECAQPETHLDQSYLCHALRDCLSDLSAEDRMILRLRFDQELPGQQIAQILNVSHGAARQRIFRALRRLEQLICELHPELLEQCDIE